MDDYAFKERIALGSVYDGLKLRAQFSGVTCVRHLEIGTSALAATLMSCSVPRKLPHEESVPEMPPKTAKLALS